MVRSRKQKRLLIAIVPSLALVSAIIGFALPAKNLGARFLHALAADLGYGVLIVILGFPLMFILAAREARAARRNEISGN
jgi:hypothetical protein